ncbi:DUF5133 domain-containing protein [Streptomyces sp. 71268]|uniref:DUF5133 domain-containing protein n=1 Tax=Streptomyces sp. 71268 TaxID=3002640 RepID=UPI0023F711E9|nr:DUF5133 domain-containing protein [Streptomyces sp. 71268]WEV29488.1 DUF5133 domain-containing protein [Streptomyces sp. 71268]
MLMAHPSVLRELIDRYEALRARCAAAHDGHERRRMEDVVYTLCVTTGTREIEAALSAARRQLAWAATEGNGPALSA